MKKCSILVVEDEALLAANLVNTLSSLGYTVHEPVATGEDAIRAVKARKPDLVLMDIQLIGEMNGIEAAEKIRAIADIPLVYLTAYTEDMRLKQAQLTEPYGYIVKPAHSRELHATIEMAMYKHGIDRKLKESELHYRELADSITDIFFAMDYDLRYTHWNKASENLTGIKSRDAIGRTISDLFTETPEIRKAKEIYLDVLKNRQPRTFENPFITGDRSIFFEIRVYPSLEGISVFTRNITERKVAEEALRESEARFKNLFVEAPLGIALIDSLTGHIYEVNPMFARIAGRTMEEMVEIDWMSITHSDDVQADLDNMALLNASKITGFQMEKRYLHHDGSVVWINMTIAPVKVDDKAHPRHLCMIEDITVRKRIEEALLESEDRFRQLFTRMPSAVAIYDGVDGGNDFIIKDFNAAAEKIEGIKKDDIIGKRVTQVFPGVKDFGIFAVFKRVWKTGQFEFFPSALYRDERDPGTWRENWVYKLASGEVIAIYHDISERKAAEEALRESEERFLNAFEYAAIGMALVSPDGRWLRVNKSTCEIVGYSENELQAMTFVDITHPDDLCTDLEYVRQMIAGEIHTYQMEKRYIHKSGDLVWVLLSVSLVRDKQRKPLYFISQIENITGRKKAEEALNESARYTRNLIEVSLDPLVTISPEGKITDVNAATELVTGYTRDHLIGTDFSDYFTDTDNAKKGYLKVFDSGVVRDYPLEIRNRDGKTTSVLYNATIYPGESGTKHGVFAAARDITERKVAEEALRQANKKLTLLSSITRHDINNQLTVLMGYLNIMEKKLPDPTLDEYFVKVGTAAQRISSMIKFTKEYESIGVNAPVWQNCRTVVDTAAKQAPLGQVMVKNDLSFGTEVFADPLIVKVFYNLMDNAVRYGGKITTIRFSVEERKSDHVVVCEDDGDGVVADEKEKIFARGFGKNTGLGLALAREILDITGITIKETGEPGKGALFEMTVPKGAWRAVDVGSNANGH